jgi:uncharacterized membrane protein (DUF2068 family)
MTDAPADTTPPTPDQAPTPAVPVLVPMETVLPAKAKPPIMLRLIAALALVKTLLFGLTGLGVLHLSHHNVEATLDALLRALNLDPDAEYLHKLVASIAGVSVKELRLISFGAFFYATLYLVEGIGLWLDQTWAEWLTIVGSGLLLPIEIREMVRHITLVNTSLFIVNIAVVVYLVMRVRRKLRLHHERTLASAAAQRGDPEHTPSA